MEVQYLAEHYLNNAQITWTMSETSGHNQTFKLGRPYDKLVRCSPGFGQMVSEHSYTHPYLPTLKHSGVNMNSAQLTWCAWSVEDENQLTTKMICQGLNHGKANSWPLPSTALETGGVRHGDLQVLSEDAWEAIQQDLDQDWTLHHERGHQLAKSFGT